LDKVTSKLGKKKKALFEDDEKVDLSKYDLWKTKRTW
jgi:hypothetical protein